MAEELAPLILCMESASGEEVALQIEPDDSVETFLAKAKCVLGFDVDLNSITNNQPISLTDNIYNYLINAEEVITEDVVQAQNVDQMDGTVQYLELIDGQQPQLDGDIQYEFIEIKDEPKPKPRSSKPVSYAPEVPFKLVPNENVNFASQFSDFVAKKNKLGEMSQSPSRKTKSSKKVKREKSLSDDELSNFKDVESTKAAYTREEILDILIDAPIENGPNKIEKNKRKPNLTKIPTNRCVCYVCGIYLDPHLRLYLFDKYDQIEMKAHDRRRQMNLSPNIVCEDCLNKDYSLFRQVFGEHQLAVDEYLIIKEKTQLIYKKRKVESAAEPSPATEDVERLSTEPFMWKNSTRKEKKIDTKLPHTSVSRNDPIPQKVTTSTIEKIVAEPVDSATAKPQVFYQTLSSDSVTNDDTYTYLEIIKNTKVSCQGGKIASAQTKSDERIENISEEADIKEEEVEEVPNEGDFEEVEYLDSTEDQVLSFLGKPQNSLIDGPSNENDDFVCRFCGVLHSHLATAITHSLKHKHAGVYPCTLCEVGYENFSMLRDHMRLSHRATHGNAAEVRASTRRGRGRPKKFADETFEPYSIPKKQAGQQSDKKHPGRPTKSKKQIEDEMREKELEELSSVLKQEMSDEEDEGIWIVQTDDNELDESIYKTLLQNHMIQEEKNRDNLSKKPKVNQCLTCRCHFATVGQLNSHDCQSSPKTEISVSATETEEILVQHATRGGDFYNSDSILADEDNMEMDQEWVAEEDGLVSNEGGRSSRRRKVKKEVTSEATVCTCHYCEVSFTSKVRLKFHMLYYGGKCGDKETGQLACHVCAAGATTFRTEAELYDHVHFAHEKRRPFVCNVDGCQKEFYLRATLTKHMRTHTDTRRYRCQQCGKRFLDKQTLDEHSVMHLDNKPYQCHICWKKLTRRSRLRMHLRAHEAEIRINLVLVCRMCDRAFRDHSAAAEHSETSTKCREAHEHESSSALFAEIDARMRAELLEKLAALCGQGQVSDAENDTKLEPQVKRSNMDNLLPSEGDERLRTLKLLFEPTDITDEQTNKLMDEIPVGLRDLIKIVEIEKAFRCEYCEDVFYLEQSLNEHRHAHRGQTNPFRCHVCNVGFSTYSRCTTHKTTHGFFKKALGDAGDDEESWTGPSAAGIVGYEDFPVVKHFLCECCSRSYLHWTYLHVHRRMKHSTPSTNMRPCRDCDLKFPNSWSLAYHRRRQHSGRSPSRGERQERDSKPMLCTECPMIFNSKNALQKHHRLQHGSGESRVGRGHGFLSCGICTRQYASKGGLEAHVKAHGPPSPLAPFACARCGKSFTLAAALMTHVKIVHARELEYSCTICTRKFCTRSSLAAHRKTHIEDKPYACPVCGHAFRTQSMCSEHVRIHTDERPFPCDVCGVAFRRSAAMRNHRLIHTGERAFPCLRCHKRFRIRSDLKTHMKMKHPGQIVVLEVGGLNPNTEQVLEQLALNNIAPEKIVDISKISVAGGASSGAAALFAEGEEALFGEGADVAWGGDMMKAIRGQGEANRQVRVSELAEADAEATQRRGRSIARNPGTALPRRSRAAVSSEPSQHILYAVDEHGNHIQIDSAQLEALCGAGAFDSSEYCLMVKEENDEVADGKHILLPDNQQLMMDDNGELVQVVDDEGLLVMMERGPATEQVYQVQYQNHNQDQDMEYKHKEDKFDVENVSEQPQLRAGDLKDNVVVQTVEN